MTTKLLHQNVDDDVKHMGWYEQSQEIMRLRNGIRAARDAGGDNKCWLDWLRLVELLPEGWPHNPARLDPETMLTNCKTFVDCIHRHQDDIACVDDAYNIWEKEKPY